MTVAGLALLIWLYALKRGCRVLVFVAGWVWPGFRPAASRILSRWLARLVKPLAERLTSLVSGVGRLGAPVVGAGGGAGDDLCAPALQGGGELVQLGGGLGRLAVGDGVVQSGGGLFGLSGFEHRPDFLLGRAGSRRPHRRDRLGRGLRAGAGGLRRRGARRL